MGHLLNNHSAICFVKFGDTINSGGVLCNQCTLDEKVSDVLEFVLVRKFFNVCNELRLWNADQRILDSEGYQFLVEWREEWKEVSLLSSCIVVQSS